MPGEFELIDRFLAPFARQGVGMRLGPGDDCAIVRPGPGAELCMTTDAVVEDVHFDLASFTDADIGHKALAVNLSDLAAMGAVPRWFLCSVACRPSDLRRIPRLAAGMAALAATHGTTLIGGNFSRAGHLSLHITAIGEVPRGKALLRSGALPGDRLYVTGTLGDAALGLQQRRAGNRSRAVFSRQARPIPRIGAGLLARRFASAAIDLSDGLVQDLGHLAKASGIRLKVDAGRLPVSRTFSRLGAELGLALNGGEDYELALLVPEARAAAFERAMAKAGETVTAIGEAAKGRGVSVLSAPAPAAGGHDHFSGFV